LFLFRIPQNQNSFDSAVVSHLHEEILIEGMQQQESLMLRKRERERGKREGGREHWRETQRKH
jgi:hypothetical protein